MTKKTHRGSDFRDFLKEEGVLDEVKARALKRARRQPRYYRPLEDYLAEHNRQ